MRAADHLRRDAPSLDPRDSLARAARSLRGRRDAVPVVNRSNLVGVLAARDLARALPSIATTLTVTEIGAALCRVSVSQILPASVVTVGLRTSIREAIRLMRTRNVSLLPITRGEEMLGVLTEEDLLDLLAETLEGIT
jgi:acetoin utilization protein AcuB